MENTFGNDTSDIRSHYKKMNTLFGKIPNLGMRRFEQLRSALNPTIEELEELIDILVTISKRYLDIYLYLGY
jgi:hypothetical protein